MNDTPHAPVLKVTRYDRVSSVLITVTVALVISCVALTIVWATNRLPDRVDAVPLELIELPGGVEDGQIDETLKLDTPEALTPDASLADIEAEESEVTEILENVVELADTASEQLAEQLEVDPRNAGKPGSADGTGRRALGFGPGESGLPREQRWFLRFPENASLDEYARQLDHFGIELGALLPGGKLVMLSKLSGGRPTQRTVTSGKGEERLYMTWQGGDRRQSDQELYQRAGITVPPGSVIFHFYPPETEALLARLEYDYRQRPANEIRRTYFLVSSNGSGYEFSVTRQSYFQ